MRTRYTPLVVVSIIALLGCSRQTEQDFNPLKGEIVFHARLEVNSDTKTVLQENGTSIFWSPDDKINVFYGKSLSGVFTSTNTTPSSLTIFTGTLHLKDGAVTNGPAADYWAVYPYSEDNSCDGTSVTLTVPSVQTATEGTFANNMFPSIARSKNSNLSFFNVCGGIRFSVYNPDIATLTIKSNAGEKLVGTVQIAFDDDGNPLIKDITTGSDEMVITAPEGGFVPGEYYFAAILPQSLSQGLTLTFTKADEKEASVSLDKILTVRRSRFGTLDEKDKDLTFVKEGGPAVPEAIDLGLSVYWASFNLGASAPEEFGDYYAWGEVEPYYSSLDPLIWKEDKEKGYDFMSYQWATHDGTKILKYCQLENSVYWGGTGSPDGKTVLDLEDDAANVILGDGWRMPTYTEFYDLLNSCEWESAVENGVSGYRVSRNGNSIFLPAAGFFMGTALQNAGTVGHYWLASLGKYGPWDGGSMIFGDLYVEYIYNARFAGQSIRPVKINPNVVVEVESITLNRDALPLQTGESITLVATITPDNASDQRIVWETTDASVASVSNGKVTAGKEGEATITAKAGGKSVTCPVSVNNDPSANASISFADAKLKAKLVEAFDANDDGEISYREAAAVTSLDRAFTPNMGENGQYTSFDEFQYFTGIKAIVDGRFASWDNLASIVLPTSITSIGDGAFSFTSLSTIDIPQGVESIGGYAFHNDSKLKEVHLHNGLKFIGNGAFTYAGVERLYIDDLNEWLKIDIQGGGHPLSPGVVSSGQVFNGHLYVNGTEVTEIVIPEGITEIKDNLFTGCAHITKVSLPEGITAIGNGAFYCCSRLEEADLSHCKISSIGYNAFSFCQKLKGIVLPNGLTTIDQWAFIDCRSLSQISIPETVTSIGWAAFAGCMSVSKIYVHATQVPVVDVQIFYDTNNCPIYVPAESVEAYRTAQNWSEYADRIWAIE